MVEQSGIFFFGKINLPNFLQLPLTITKTTPTGNGLTIAVGVSYKILHIPLPPKGSHLFFGERTSLPTYLYGIKAGDESLDVDTLSLFNPLRLDEATHCIVNLHGVCLLYIHHNLDGRHFRPYVNAGCTGIALRNGALCCRGISHSNSLCARCLRVGNNAATQHNTQCYKHCFKIIHNTIVVIQINNPLEICQLGGFCSFGPTYKIRKGESYKIYITTQHVFDSYRYVHYLPSFSIQFIEPKGIKPEFGKEISFDIDNNNKFESNFSEDGSLFIRVDFNISNLLDIIISSSIDNYSTTIQPPGLQTVIPFKKEKNIEIYLKYKSASNEKGKIWMYLSTQEIKVNLNQTYEFKYDFKRTCGHQIASNLIYSIDNAEYNALLQFKYNNKLIIDKNMNAGNPMKILDGKEYKTNITSYIINKGNSYKIYINTKFFDLKNIFIIYHIFL